MIVDAHDSRPVAGRPDHRRDHGDRQAGVLREFARLLKATGRIEDSEELLRVLVERESLGSTGIGDGVAIPHGKLDVIQRYDRRLRQIEQGYRFPVPGSETGLSFFSPGHARRQTRRPPEGAGPHFPHPQESCFPGQASACAAPAGTAAADIEEDSKYPQR